jgi:hypothetical protein
MTAYVRNAGGIWQDNTKWTPNGIPGSADDTDISTYTVTVPGGTAQANTVTGASGGQLDIQAAGTLEVFATTAITMVAGMEIHVHGTLKGNLAGRRVVLEGDGFQAFDGCVIQNVTFYVRNTYAMSDIFADNLQADMLTCRFAMDGASSAFTCDQDFAFSRFEVAHASASVTIDAGIDMVMADEAGAVFSVIAGATFAVNGTYALPVTLAPSADPPSQKLDVRICSANATISYFHINYVQVAIGKTTSDYIGLTRTPRVGQFQRPPIIDSDACLGRGKGRIHRRGNEAGSVDVEGTWQVSELQWEYVDEMKEAGATGFFMSQYVQIPNCKVLSHEIEPSDMDYRKYIMTLIEDE